MIQDNDRSWWFGASDTRFVVGNRDTKTWKKWWDVKTGAPQEFNGNIFTAAGNMYERAILESITSDMNFDRQIVIPSLRLRVNYDGDYEGTIYEVKTHRVEHPFKTTKSYWYQAQAEMFAYKKRQKGMKIPTFNRLWIVSYGLYADEYSYPAEIDFNRILFHEVKYDEDWIKETYLPNLKELAKNLKKELKNEFDSSN